MNQNVKQQINLEPAKKEKKQKKTNKQKGQM